MEANTESLLELAHRYFTRKGLNVNFNVDVKKVDGKMQKLDIVAGDQSGKIGVLVTNWERSIGVNVIRKLSRIVQGTELKDGILIGDSFSEHCRQFAKNYNVKLLSKSKMLQEMDEL
jgi:hypothetical protein